MKKKTTTSSINNILTEIRTGYKATAKIGIIVSFEAVLTHYRGIQEYTVRENLVNMV